MMFGSSDMTGIGGDDSTYTEAAEKRPFLFKGSIGLTNNTRYLFARKSIENDTAR